MSDNTPTPETVTKTVTDPVAEALPDPIEEVAEHPENEIPPWGKDLTDKVDTILSQLATAVDPTDDGAVTDSVEMPKDGGIVPDESPAKKPWTHRSLFGGN